MTIKSVVANIFADLKAAETKTVADLNTAEAGLIPKIQVFVRIHGLSVGLVAGGIGGLIAGSIISHL